MSKDSIDNLSIRSTDYEGGGKDKRKSKKDYTETYDSESKRIQPMTKDKTETYDSDSKRIRPMTMSEFGKELKSEYIDNAPSFKPEKPTKKDWEAVKQLFVRQDFDSESVRGEDEDNLADNISIRSKDIKRKHKSPEIFENERGEKFVTNVLTTDEIQPSIGHRLKRKIGKDDTIETNTFVNQRELERQMPHYVRTKETFNFVSRPPNVFQQMEKILLNLTLATMVLSAVFMCLCLFWCFIALFRRKPFVVAEENWLIFIHSCALIATVVFLRYDVHYFVIGLGRPKDLRLHVRFFFLLIVAEFIVLTRVVMVSIPTKGFKFEILLLVPCSVARLVLEVFLFVGVRLMQRRLKWTERQRHRLDPNKPQKTELRLDLEDKKNR